MVHSTYALSIDRLWCFIGIKKPTRPNAKSPLAILASRREQSKFSFQNLSLSFFPLFQAFLRAKSFFLSNRICLPKVLCKRTRVVFFVVSFPLLGFSFNKREKNEEKNAFFSSPQKELGCKDGQERKRRQNWSFLFACRPNNPWNTLRMGASERLCVCIYVLISPPPYISPV